MTMFRKSQTIKSGRAQKVRNSKKEGLEDAGAWSSICIELNRLDFMGFRRQSANGQHNAGIGRLHCDLCSVLCRSDCVTILDMTCFASSGFLHRWLEKRWFGCRCR